MDRKKALEEFTILTSVLRAGISEESTPTLVNQMLENVKVIQETKKKPPCPDCRARRLCTRNLAVPILTDCISCGKEIVFLVPVEHQDAPQWDKPVARISQTCPHSVRKKQFAWCPDCRKYPDRIESTNRSKESRKEGLP